jgi:hypothetical protein
MKGGDTESCGCSYCLKLRSSVDHGLLLLDFTRYAADTSGATNKVFGLHPHLLHRLQYAMEANPGQSECLAEKLHASPTATLEPRASLRQTGLWPRWQTGTTHPGKKQPL